MEGNDGRVSFGLNTSSLMQSVKTMSDNINKTLRNANQEMKGISGEFKQISTEINNTTRALIEATKAMNGEFNKTLGDFKRSVRSQNEPGGSKGLLSKIDTGGNVLSEGFGRGVDHGYDNFSMVDELGEVVPSSKFGGFLKSSKIMFGELGKITGDAVNDIKNSIFSKKEDPKDTIMGQLSGVFHKQAIIGMALKMGRELTGFVKDSLQVASDIEETQNVVRNTFKQHMGDMEDFANSSIEAMGISSLKAKQYASTYKSMMSGLTIINEDTRTELSKTLTGMAADIGSFFSSTMDTDEAFEMLKAPLDKQSLKVAKIGVNMTQESLEEWGKNYGIMYKDLSLQEQTLMRIAFIMDQTSVAQGDFIKNSDSWHNQLELIKNKLVEIKGEFGAIFIDLLKPALKFINDVLDVFLAKVNSIIDAIYKRLGRERPEVEVAENKGTIGAGHDITQQLIQEPEQEEKQEEKKERSNNKELDVLGIDNLSMLKTDYTDPEKEKDRKIQSNQFNKVYDLLQENMDKRDLAIEKALKDRDKEKGPLFYIVKDFVDKFKELFGDNVLDIKEGIEGIVKGIKRVVGDMFTSFIDTSIEIGTKDLIDKITNEIKEIGGTIGEIFGDGEDAEVKTIGDIIGRLVAYYVKMALSFLYIFLKIFNAVLSILRDSGLLVIIGEGLEMMMAGIVAFLDMVVKLLEMITKPIIDPEGTAYEDVKRDEEFQEMRASGEYSNWELIKASFAKNAKKELNSMFAALPDAVKLLTGNKDKTYMHQRRMMEQEFNLFGSIDRRDLISSQEPNLIGGDFALAGAGGEVVNNVSVNIDGREVQAYVEEEQQRRRRTKGIR